MTRSLPATSFLVLLALPITAVAQFPFPEPPFSKAESSGALEQARRGLESVVRAQSQSSSSGPSSPLIDAQTAESMSYDNQIKATNTYFQKRQLNRMYREAERGPRNTAADFNRFAQQRAPNRMTSSQMDSYTGRINWPVVLRTEAYRAPREKVDALYVRHTAAGGGINTYEYAEIKQLTLDMQSQLRGDVSKITPEQYTYARNFLESLRYEARQVAGS